MGNKQTIIKQVSFEDIQFIINNNSNNYILINILPSNLQCCLIKKTIAIANEVTIINNNMANSDILNIIIYGANANDSMLLTKYEQLNNLGFKHIYIYPGGIFEWLMLQDIYGYDQFPTNNKELDILKYKPMSILNKLLLNDI